MTSKVNWHKSAARDVRPFFGAVSLESSMEAAEIQLFEDAKFSADPSFVVEPTDVEKLAISIRLNFNQKLAFEAVKKGDLVLAVTAVQPFLKKTRVVAQYPIDNELPTEISIGDEILADLGGGSNINVDVALCLAKRLPKKPGSPFLLGHWLSKKSFALRAPKLAEEFDIEPTDDEAWKKIGYPAKTLYLVEYFTGMNEPVAKDKQTARVRVHSDVYKKLSAEVNQRLAKPMLAELAAEISCQMLAASWPDWELDEEVAPQSPLAAFMKKIQRLQPCALDDLKKMVREPGMPKLRALLHVDQQTVRSIVEA